MSRQGSCDVQVRPKINVTHHTKKHGDQYNRQFLNNTYQSAEKLLFMCFRTLDVSNPSQEMR